MIGALSFVIVVWLGTSMNCSRRSTLTGRSMIGIRKRRPGPRTMDLVGLAEPEHDHLLVLLHDPDGQVEDDQQDGDDDDGRTTSTMIGPSTVTSDSRRALIAPGHVPSMMTRPARR